MKLLYLFTLALFISASAYVFFGEKESGILRYLPRTNENLGKENQSGIKSRHVEKQSAPTAEKVHQLEAGNWLTPSVVGLTAIKTVDLSSAAPGATLNYTVVISNPSLVDVNGVAFSDDIDLNTTLVEGSVKSSPVAADDQYSSLGNVGISVPVGNGILANDYMGTNPAAVFTAVVNGTTTGNGTINISADGSFTYTPAAGFTGTDTYVYTLTNTAGSNNGTISITVANPIWFIDNNYTGTTADGRISTPFKTIGAFQAINDGAALHPANDHVIFVYESATNYTGNITLRKGQKLIGQDATASLLTITGYTLPTYSSPALPAMNTGGNLSKLISTTASTPVVNLTTDATASYTIRGISIGDKTADALSAGIAGTNFGTVTFSDGGIDGTGQALLLATGTLNGTFAYLSSSSGPTGISLTTIAGTTTATTGSFTGNGTGVFMSGGTGSLTYGGSVSNSSTLLVSIGSKTAGTVDFNGLLSSGAGGRGISLVNNTGAIFRFDGGLTLNTGTNNAFSATGGGTVHVTQDNTTIINTIVSTSGIGLQIANTTIGTDGVTFRSINVNGATRGISLNTTGTGAFTVIGQSTTPASGGTIQNISIRGIELISAQNISLNNIQLTSANTTDAGGAGVCDEVNNINCNAALYIKDATTVALTRVNITTTVEQGMNMNNVTGLTISNCAVTGCGDATEEGALKIRDLKGTSSITSSSFKNSPSRNAHILNNNGSTTFTVSASDFSNDTYLNTRLDCFEMRTQTNATATVTLSNSTFNRAGTKGIQIFAENTSTMDLTITGATVDRFTNPMAGIEVGSDQTAQMDANVDDITKVTSDLEVGVNVYSGTTSNMEATVRNSIIQGGNNPISTFSNLRAMAAGGSTSKVQFEANTVSLIDISGIQVATDGSNSSLSAIVKGNSVTSTNAAAIAGMEAQAIAPVGFSTTNCTYILNNTVTVTAGTRHFRARTGSALSTINLQGTAAASTAALYTANGNSAAGVPIDVISQVFPGSAINNGGAFTCPAPTILIAALDDIPVEEPVFASDNTHEAQAEEPIPALEPTRELKRNLRPVSDPPLPPVSVLPQTAHQINVVAQNVSVSGFNLAAGETITIKFQVTVNNPFPTGVCSVSNQGTVSATALTDIQTDNDADAINGINPTVTTIPVPPSIITPQNNINVNTDAGQCTSSQSFGVTADGCPAPTITYTTDVPAATITSPHAFPIGVTTVTVSVSNGVGSAATSSFTVTVTSPAPTISSVTVPANENYSLGENLDFVVNFSAAVFVTGTPQLPLTIGANARNANYVSGSGTSALTFRYTVANTDQDPNGIVVGNALSLNGGTINNSCGTAAVLTLNNVGSTINVWVDGIVPTVTINQAAGQADPASGAPINFTVVFSEAVTGFDNTDVSLTGSTAGLTTIVVTPVNSATYNVAVSGTSCTAGTVVATIPAGRASDGAGNGNTASSSTDNTVTFAATITVNNCPGTVNVSTGPGACTATATWTVPTATDACGNNVPLFSNTHNPGDIFPVGPTLVTYVFASASGNTSCAFTVVVSATAPGVTSVAVPTNGYYKLGDQLNFTVNFDAAIVVTGSPQLPLTIGANARNASYISGSGTSALVFRYTVANTDEDHNGIAVGSSLNLNGGTLKNTCGTNASLTLSSVGTTTGINVDGIIPTVTINQASGQADPALGLPVKFTAVFSEGITGFTDVDVSLTGSSSLSTVTITEKAPMDGTTFEVAVGGTVGCVQGTVIVSIAASRVIDGAGNGNSASTSTDNEVTVNDFTPPTITPITPTPAVLWPPDHKMKTINFAFTHPTDNCPGTVTMQILSISSSDPQHGTGDGDLGDDWSFNANDPTTAQLRAERGVGKNARVYTITFIATDAIGNTATSSTTVRIAHNITTPASGTAFKVGSTVSLQGVFWDIPGNRHTAKWLIDGNTLVNGSVTEPSGYTNGKVTGSYKFNTPGIYKLQMNVTDQKGVTSYANTNEDLEAIVVIYDPNGGFTFGGGWFASPAGSIPADPQAEGKVSFGFQTNYYKNATFPKGETQMEFKVGELEYNALNYDYLMISGSKAQFKGTGKIIGGQSGINFIMTVIDGQLDGTGIDRIRMKIYNRNTGEVYYDNQPGASDAADPTMVVGNGSVITIKGNVIPTNTIMQPRMDELTKPLAVSVIPNPSRTYFNLIIESGREEDLTLRVVNVLGQQVEGRAGLPANGSIRIGDNYRPGLYFVEIGQGKERRLLKLVKLAD